MNELSRRDLLGAGLAFCVNHAIGQPTRQDLAFYLDHLRVNEDPAGNNLDIYSKARIPMVNNFGLTGKRVDRHMVLSFSKIHDEVETAIAAGRGKAAFWPEPKPKLDRELREKIEEHLGPRVVQNGRYSGSMYLSALKKAIYAAAPAALAEAAIAAVSASELGLPAIVLTLGFEFAIKVFEQLENCWHASSIVNSLKDDPILVHGFEVDITKSRTRLVNGDRMKGLYLSETIWYESQPSNSRNNKIYYPLWKAEYTALVSLKMLLDVPPLPSAG